MAGRGGKKKKGKIPSFQQRLKSTTQSLVRQSRHRIEVLTKFLLDTEQNKHIPKRPAHEIYKAMQSLSYDIKREKRLFGTCTSKLTFLQKEFEDRRAEFRQHGLGVKYRCVNKKHQTADTVALHNMTTQEALTAFQLKVVDAELFGPNDLTFIVGQGSTSAPAKILKYANGKPQLHCQTAKNKGRLEVKLP